MAYPYYTPIPFPGDGLGGSKQPANAALWNSRYLELAVAIGNLASLAGLDSASVVAAILALDTKVDGVMTNVDTIDTRVDVVEAAATSLDSRTDTLEAGAISLDSRTDTLEAGAISLDSRTDTLEAGAISLDSRTDTLEAGAISLDSRTDTLETTTAGHTSEIVAGRGDYSTLDDRLDDAYLRGGNVLLVDAAYSGDHANQWRYNDLATALAAAVDGTTILIAPGIYTGDVTIADNNVRLLGSGAPSYDAGSGRLVGGTIIRGRISLGSTISSDIRDLGVDLVGVNSKDCIGANLVGAAYRRFQNLTLLGNGYDALSHGLFGAGDYNIIRDCQIFNCYHGCAIHGSYTLISNMFFYSCAGSSLIIKGKSGVNCRHVQVNNISIQGDDSGTYKVWGGPVVLQVEDGTEVKHCNIANVSARYCVNGVVQLTQSTGGGTVSYCTFNNIHSENNNDIALVGDFWIKTGTAINFTNCSSTNRAAGYGFSVDLAGNATGITVNSSTGDTTGSGLFNGVFAYLELNSLPTAFSTIHFDKQISNRGALISGTVSADAGIAVTAANTPIANLANGVGNPIDYAGIVLIWVRSAIGTASSDATYSILVFKGQYSGGVGAVVDIAKAGLTTGGAASFPSFTFDVDPSGNTLRASPVASTSDTFYFSFVAIGNLKITKI